MTVATLWLFPRGLRLFGAAFFLGAAFFGRAFFFGAVFFLKTFFDLAFFLFVFFLGGILAVYRLPFFFIAASNLAEWSATCRPLKVMAPQVT